MTLNGKESKDKFIYRKGGYCKFCDVKVTSLWSHQKTKKHKINNPKNIPLLKKKIKEKKKPGEKIYYMKLTVESSDEKPIILFGD